MRPRLLDLYCCAGGAAVGYHRAGFDVTGVDIDPQPNYPFAFHRADAIEFVAAHGHEFDAVHASPPCQSSSALTKGTNRGRTYPDLIAPTRAALIATGLPTVLENVQGAAVRRDLILCGEMFALDVIRHRYFECEGFPTVQPLHVRHRGRVAGMRHGVWYTSPYFAVYGEGGGKGSVTQWRAAMGIDWTWERREIAEAVPPAYTEFVGRQLIERIGAVAA